MVNIDKFISGIAFLPILYYAFYFLLLGLWCYIFGKQTISYLLKTREKRGIGEENSRKGVENNVSVNAEE